MATSEAQEIKKQETLVRFSIISYKTRLRVFSDFGAQCFGCLARWHRAKRKKLFSNYTPE